MNFILQPWQFFILIVAGWINRQQQEVIEYLRAENQVLKEKFGKKRILLNDDQRCRLAVKAKILGHKLLEEVGTLFTPDTILRWHRQLVAKKWDYSEERQSVGRPRIRQVIVDLVLRFATENPTWGYDRIQGALANVGYHISDTTVGNTCLVVDGEEWYRTSRQLALAYFEWGTNWSIFRRAHRFLVIHAATLARNGVGLMMPAAPGSGKSTLCAALAHRGWRLFSDELALIDPDDARLVPLAKPVCLKDQSIATIREFAPQAEFGPLMYDTQEKRHVAHVRPPAEAVDNVQQTAQPRLIVFPQYEASSPTIFTPLSRGDAFLQTARQSFNYSILGARGFKLLGDVLKQCDCYSLTYSNLDEAIQQIDALAASASQPLVHNHQC